ncbi:MAG: hypothetical protein ACM4AI_07165 [Acidobacteriota bacterium]
MWRGAAIAVGVTTIVTLIVAWPVVRSPAEMIFGREIVGRHHDAYTVMLQIGAAGTSGTYAQPVTDRLGWLFARAMNPVSAYNLLVLLSFPLTAGATYVLARRLIDSHTAALIAALAFTFAPVRLAHAAYHPHIVQTQWLVLYLLSLFALVDAPSWFRAAAVTVAFAAMVLSNYYAGLIGAVVTPIALVAYWASRPPGVRTFRSLAIAMATVTGVAAAGITAIAASRPDVFTQRSLFAFDISDIPRFSARWWAYLTPPVDHPFLGAWAANLFSRNGETISLVEQQVFVSYALIVLAALAAVTAARQWRSDPKWRPILSILAIGAAAAIVSAGPISGSCAGGSWAPACLIYAAAPMFRSYARFAIVVQLAVAVAAGAGAAMLARQSRAGLMLATGLLTVAAIDYLPVPWRAHDVLPTAGHRWLARQPHADRIFDCTQGDAAQAAVPSLMNRSVSFLSSSIPTCADPQIGVKLVTLRYTHMVVRLGPRDSQPVEPAECLAIAARFPDSAVYSVAQVPPPVLSTAASGFFEYEHVDGDWWRWMGQDGTWTVRNTTTESRTVLLLVRLASAGEPRTLTLTLDDQPPRHLEVSTSAHESIVGPWTLAPGDHTLTLTASGTPLRPSDDGRSSDTRRLTVMFKSERWIDVGGR